MARGALAGLRIIEFAGIGPAPFAAMLLADMGAEVLQIARPDAHRPPATSLLERGRHRLHLDMKSEDGRERCGQAIERADVLIEGYRPGVMERLGFGPDQALSLNPRLVYGRMTGWGQEGPLASAAGHDITYAAISGALHAIGDERGPVPPLNLIGDFGGGALYLALGVCAALVERQRSGRGQMVDAAMVDGAASLMTLYYGQLAEGRWKDERHANILDGAAPYYRLYECADGKHIAVGPIEPQFYACLCAMLGSPPGLERASLTDHDSWPAQRQQLADIFRRKSRDEWAALLSGTDACVAPVLSLEEAPAHEHNRARATFIGRDGIIQPNAAPRFSRTPSALADASPIEDGAALLSRWLAD
ncbi:CaiB/BaiF CoA transferase family protein, partial [Sphingomonas sp. YL-JM2C]